MVTFLFFTSPQRLSQHLDIQRPRSYEVMLEVVTLNLRFSLDVISKARQSLISTRLSQMPQLLQYWTDFSKMFCTLLNSIYCLVYSQSKRSILKYKDLSITDQNQLFFIFEHYKTYFDNLNQLLIMIPFQKIFVMLIRTFSRPMLGYFKKKQQENQMNNFTRVFIYIGRKSYTLQSWMNNRILKNNMKRHHEVQQQVLLEKGIETFYQILFYLIVLGLPFWELYKSSIAAQKKEENLQNRIKGLEKSMVSINKNIFKLVEHIKQKEKTQKLKNSQKSQNLNLQKNKQLQQIETKYQKLQQGEGQSMQQKLQEMIQNAVQVVADEFQDVLDDIDITQISQQASIDIDVNEIDAEAMSSDDIEVDTGESQSVDISADVESS